MGRRALRKIPPGIDLSRHLMHLEQMRSPFQPHACFGNASPLEIEVGSGKGLFLTTAGATYPDRSFLGIEVAKKYAEFTASRLARRQLNNVRVIHGDAQIFFRDHLDEACAAAVHIYFPDPWWKNRHHKRRIMNLPFLLQIVRVLAPGGSLHFWTDVEEYHRQSLELIAASVPLRGPYEVSELPASHSLDYRTHFERRSRIEGQPVYRAQFRKAEP